MRIDSSGRVGIGTSSIGGSSTTKLHLMSGTTSSPTVANDADELIIEGSGSSGMTFLSTSSSNIRFGDAADSSVGQITYNHSGNHLLFGTNNAERMRIDSSGNLLVGTTSFNTGFAGGGITNYGFNYGTVNNGLVARFTRLTSDGDILQFRKDGSNVGSIGTAGGDFTVNAQSLGVLQVGGVSKYGWTGSLLYPTSDNTSNLGTSNFRFKDLHLSGNANVGGTVSATSFTGSGANLTGIEGVPQGVIVMWSGQTSAIPSGWALCDGTNGTPNLTNKFIRGATTSNELSTGGQDSVTLATGNLPSHTHSFSGTTNTTGSHAHSGTADSAGAHTHTISSIGSLAYPQNSPNQANQAGYGRGDTLTTNSAGAHTHNLSIDNNGNHSHTISGTTGSTGSGSAFDNKPAYMALAYIMKT